ncbi:import inner membrane translocasesubunit Tim17 [Monoraphidium neglectum]|uniref:Import inner membrane translocasesubunit Tim17 n=1 Tax=Monoraphidium neglectum TaxID=145388 RepID=A0A0D2LTT2_9CHLO|nr:import inner membrane translocasesubunit Tim17 [Monoraphidium neglectum]KIY95069.1 import inner membrane translocasesubunit Tim17 [Monoraphidium neglectum]|eukprot:XP_013894089.1 import inner membrane translocasesubunit Tim17 [Monoraphidium neglectum]
MNGRLTDDIGGAFGMGALGGGLWHTYRGLKNSPKGYKIAGTLETLRRESPRIGGNFANWGLMFSVFDCSCMYIRQKEDPFNAIMAGALTGGFLQIRSGLKPAFRSAVFGGVLLAVIEGLGITLSKMMAAPPPGAPMQQPPGMPPGAPGVPPPLPPSLGPEAVLSPAAAPGGELAGAGIGGGAAPGGGDAGSSGGGGGFWSWLSGGEDKSKVASPSSSEPHTFSDDKFAPPPMPEGFKSH